jgi:hypothetical protein
MTHAISSPRLHSSNSPEGSSMRPELPKVTAPDRRSFLSVKRASADVKKVGPTAQTPLFPREKARSSKHAIPLAHNLAGRDVDSSHVKHIRFHLFSRGYLCDHGESSSPQQIRQ